MVTKGDLCTAQGSSYAQKYMQLLLSLVFRSSVFRCRLNWVSMVGKETKEIFFFTKCFDFALTIHIHEMLIVVNGPLKLMPLRTHA